MNNNIENLDLEDELFEHFRFEVPKGQAFLRIDKYLMNLIQNATRNKIQNAATEGNIFVNDIPVKSNYKVKPFDVVTVMLSHPPFENHILPEDLPLNIVYEDDALLLINKRASSSYTIFNGRSSGRIWFSNGGCDNITVTTSNGFTL